VSVVVTQVKFPVGVLLVNGGEERVEKAVVVPVLSVELLVIFHVFIFTIFSLHGIVVLLLHGSPVCLYLRFLKLLAIDLYWLLGLFLLNLA